MLKYLLGLIKHLPHRGVSLLALVDNRSVVKAKVKINRFAKVYDSSIDDYSYVGSGTELVCADVGKFCSIAHRCSIGLAKHPVGNISTSPIFTNVNNGTGHSWSDIDLFDEFERVTVGNDVWIGVEAIIMGGVRIGNGAVIGAGSIVTKDIPDYAIAVGTPAKIVKYRFQEEMIAKLLTTRWWNLPDNVLRDNIRLFQMNRFQMDDLERIEQMNK